MVEARKLTEIYAGKRVATNIKENTDGYSSHDQRRYKKEYRRICIYMQRNLKEVVIPDSVNNRRSGVHGLHIFEECYNS